MRRTICNSSRSVQRFTTMTALLLALFLLSATAAWAHKVSVFAYVDGQNLVIDAFYSKSNKVRQGKISVQNAASGEVYLAATTDENGALSVPVPPRAIAAKADLRILLVAGEGLPTKHPGQTPSPAQQRLRLRSPLRARRPHSRLHKPPSWTRPPSRASWSRQWTTAWLR
jgi:nickel transport protein